MKKWLLVFLSLFVVVSSGLFAIFLKQPERSLSPEAVLELTDSYSAKVQPIFNAKCVACHSCYNSPCQLNLSSYEGVARGANKVNVYDFPLLESRAPTRLYVDADTNNGWRKLGFYSVTRGPRETASLMETMIEELPGVESGRQKAYLSEESRVCSASLGEELAAYQKANPAGRMPYGLPRLADHEISSINQWLNEAAHPPSTREMEAKILNHEKVREEVAKWESLLNGEDMKSRLSSRYIYEHLFLAHIYFQAQPQLFFRLVRSRTQEGEVDEIATSYPSDSPGKKFFYRFRPVTNTLTLKDHIPFALSDRKFAWYRTQFYVSKWENVPKEMPPYGRAGSNPFQTFISIPVRARYEFLLHEAGYHVMTFIKGPVCRGQTAVNVINDKFWVLFAEPDQDAMVNDRDLEKKIAANSAFPAEAKDDIIPFADYRDRYWQNVRLKNTSLRARQQVLGAKSIWNGRRSNTNATLTIYRHFDSAHVLRGLRGNTPRTAWVIDYQIFESIYYNLTAGYNVFGPLLHQVNSRLYMEMSRLAAEDLFLTHLPESIRAKERASWNRPTPDKTESLAKTIVDTFLGDVRAKLKYEYPYSGQGIESASIQHHDPNPKKAFLGTLFKERFSRLQAGSTGDYIKNDFGIFRDHHRDTGLLSRIPKLPADVARYLPETILLRIKETDQIYTLIHNKEHFNVSMMFLEDDRRDPKSDDVDLIRGVATSYANAFIVLEPTQVSNFVRDLESASTPARMEEFLKKYVLARTNREFWAEYEWFSRKTVNRETNESGWLDLNRYLP